MKSFKADAMPSFEHSGWDPKRKLARTTPKLFDNPRFSTLLFELEDDLLKEHTNMVYLDTGKPCRNKKISRYEEELKTSALKNSKLFNRTIIKYHNDLHSHRFTSNIKAYKNDAAGYLRRYESRYPDQHESTWSTRMQLLSVLANPKPLLGPVENSERAFSLRPSLTTIRSDVRRIFTQDWYEYDLRSAQLAIIAKDWRIKELQDLLIKLGDASIWTYLASELGVNADTSKKAIKTGMYALAFGAQEGTIKRSMLEEGGDQSLVASFLKHDLIQVILEHRRKQFAAWTEDDETFGFQSAFTDKRTRSLLAGEAQLKEVQLLLPIYKLLEEFDENNEDVTIMLYQFDGVTVRYKNEKIAKRWEARIKEAVKKNAEDLGVVTALVGGRVVPPTL